MPTITYNWCLLIYIKNREIKISLFVNILKTEKLKFRCG